MTGLLIAALIILVVLLVISGIVARMHAKTKHLDHEWFSKDQFSSRAGQVNNTILKPLFELVQINIAVFTKYEDAH